jgi:regulatory protein
VEVPLPRRTVTSSALATPSAYGRAVAKLSRRDHAEAELRRALRRAGHPEDEVDSAVLRLKAQRAIDDGRFAEAFSRSRLRHRGLGSNRIRAELRQRGVGRAVAEKGLREAQGDVSEAEALEALARRYWKQRAADEPARRVQKLWAFLLRRGYPVDLVSTRLRALWPRWSDALNGLEPREDES